MICMLYICVWLRFYYMVGEPYHGGDFMSLTQQAKEQKVPMTEASNR